MNAQDSIESLARQVSASSSSEYYLTLELVSHLI